MQTMLPMPDVETLMAAGLGDWLDQQAQAREAAKRRMYMVGGIGMGIAAIFALAAMALGWAQFGYITAALIAAAALGWASNIRQEMINTLKQGMNGALARALDIEYSVAAVKGQECERALEYGILPSFDDEYYQDYWRGRVGDTDFTLYEVHLTEERGSGKNRSTVTVFQGIILRMAFAREFLGTTVLRRNSAIKFTLFGDSISGDGQKLERIKMVHPDFEDAFDVYSSDPVEAHYLVHPVYIERLIALEREFAGDNLAAIFHGGDMIITIETENMFESASMDAEQDRTGLTRTIAQFAEVARLMTALNERPRSQPIQ